LFESIRVRNFRSVEDSRTLRLADLNLVVGPNNSGKSSCLIYPLLMIKQTLEDPGDDNCLVTSGPQVDLGGYLNLIHRGDPKAHLAVEFVIKPEALPRPRFAIEFRNGHGLSLEPPPFVRFSASFYFDASENRVGIEHFELRTRSGRIVFEGIRKGNTWEIAGLPEKMAGYVAPRFRHFLPYPGPCGEPPKERALVAEILARSQAWFARVSDVARAAKRIRYVTPIREVIPRHGLIGKMPSSELGPKGANLMRVLAEDVRAQSGELLRALNHWLSRRLGLMGNVKLRFVDKAKTIVSLVADAQDDEGHWINLADMGCGVSQLVPVIVQTVLLPENGCLLIEQPEIHLHPAAQAGLADLFVEMLGAEKGRRQFIVETHSEHLVLRVRRRIAEGKLDASRVKIFFVQMKAGRTWVRQLRLDRSGHFPRWPRGFFEEGYREAEALATAQSTVPAGG